MPPSNTLQEETEMTSPETYANFVEDLVEKCSPKKKECLSLRGIGRKEERSSLDACIKGVKKLVTSVKQKRSKCANQARCMVNRMYDGVPAKDKKKLASMNLWMSSKVTTRYDLLLKKRSDALPDPLILKIKDFYQEVSNERTEKKFHSKKLMSMSVQCAHKQFLRDNPNVRCSSITTTNTNINMFTVIALRPQHTGTKKRATVFPSI